MSIDKVELYHNLIDALNRPIKDDKKIEYYEYFRECLKPVLKKNEYNEKIDENRGTIDLIISPGSLTAEQLATLLGIILPSQAAPGTAGDHAHSQYRVFNLT